MIRFFKLTYYLCVAIELENQEAGIGQYLDRHLDDSTLSSDSGDAALELDSQLRFSTSDNLSFGGAAADARPRNASLFSLNNFPEDWNENEDENADEAFPWNLEQMSTPELKHLATQLYEQVSQKTNSYPERIASNTEADLSIVLEEFKRNFANLLDLVNTESVDDEAAEEIDDKLEQLDEKKNILFGRLAELRQKKERCADLILRFRANSGQPTSGLSQSTPERSDC